MDTSIHAGTDSQPLILVVVTARPSWGRIQTACEAARDQGQRVQVLAVGGACAPRYGRIADQIASEGFTVEELPGLWDDSHPGGMVQMTGALTAALGQAIRRLEPALVVTIADRYETLATAIAASYQYRPLCHVQGGEVTGNIDDKVRNAVSQLADLHCTATTEAAIRVRQSGAKGRVVVTGCPSIDLALRTPDGPVTLPGIGPVVDTDQPFLLVLQHPVTDQWDQARAQAEQTLAAVQAVGLPVIWCAPNQDAGAEGIEKAIRVAHEAGAPIRFIRHVPPADFIRLMRRCAAMVGNSSAAIREGSALGTPALVVGSRQSGRLCGPNVVHVESVTVDALSSLLRRPRPPQSYVYGDGQAGPRIAELWAAVSRARVDRS